MWYVASMSNAIGAYKTKAEAIGELMSLCMDGRKRPKVERICVGMYEYFPPSDGSGVYATYCIGTKENMIEHGFEWIFEELENKEGLDG